MLKYLLLILIIFCTFFCNISKKKFIEVSDGYSNTNIFNNTFGSIFTTLAALVMYLFDFNFNPLTLIYSLLFGICVFVASYVGYLAIKTGPLSLSVLIVSYYLIMPVLYGIISLGEPINATVIIGIVLICISLLLITKKSKDVKLSLKWFFYVAIGFLVSGFGAIVNKAHQIAYNGSFTGMHMFFSMLFALIGFLIIFIFSKKDRTKELFKKTWLYIVPSGILGSVANFLLLILIISIPASIAYPLVTAGGIIATYIGAVTIFKEKLSVLQLCGYFLGLVSVVILNI